MAKAVLDELLEIKKEKTPPARLHDFHKIRNCAAAKRRCLFVSIHSAASLLPGRLFFFQIRPEDTVQQERVNVAVSAKPKKNQQHA